MLQPTAASKSRVAVPNGSISNHSAKERASHGLPAGPTAGVSPASSRGAGLDEAAAGPGRAADWLSAAGASAGAIGLDRPWPRPISPAPPSASSPWSSAPASAGHKPHPQLSFAATLASPPSYPVAGLANLPEPNVLHPRNRPNMTQSARSPTGAADSASESASPDAFERVDFVVERIRKNSLGYMPQDALQGSNGGLRLVPPASSGHGFYANPMGSLSAGHLPSGGAFGAGQYLPPLQSPDPDPSGTLASGAILQCMSPEPLEPGQAPSFARQATPLTQHSPSANSPSALRPKPMTSPLLTNNQVWKSGPSDQPSGLASARRSAASPPPMMIEHPEYHHIRHELLMPMPPMDASWPTSMDDLAAMEARDASLDPRPDLAAARHRSLSSCSQMLNAVHDEPYSGEREVAHDGDQAGAGEHGRAPDRYSVADGSDADDVSDGGASDDEHAPATAPGPAWRVVGSPSSGPGETLSPGSAAPAASPSSRYGPHQPSPSGLSQRLTRLAPPDESTPWSPRGASSMLLPPVRSESVDPLLMSPRQNAHAAPDLSRLGVPDASPPKFTRARALSDFELRSFSAGTLLAPPTPSMRGAGAEFGFDTLLSAPFSRRATVAPAQAANPPEAARPSALGLMWPSSSTSAPSAPLAPAPAEAASVIGELTAATSRLHVANFADDGSGSGLSSSSSKYLRSRSTFVSPVESVQAAWTAANSRRSFDRMQQDTIPYGVANGGGAARPSTPPASHYGHAPSHSPGSYYGGGQQQAALSYGYQSMAQSETTSSYYPGQTSDYLPYGAHAAAAAAAAAAEEEAYMMRYRSYSDPNRLYAPNGPARQSQLAMHTPQLAQDASLEEYFHVNSDMSEIAAPHAYYGGGPGNSGVYGGHEHAMAFGRPRTVSHFGPMSYGPGPTGHSASGYGPPVSMGGGRPGSGMHYGSSRGPAPAPAHGGAFNAASLSNSKYKGPLYIVEFKSGRSEIFYVPSTGADGDDLDEGPGAPGQSTSGAGASSAPSSPSARLLRHGPKLPDGSRVRLNEWVIVEADRGEDLGRVSGVVTVEWLQAQMQVMAATQSANPSDDGHDDHAPAPAVQQATVMSAAAAAALQAASATLAASAAECIFAPAPALSGMDAAGGSSAAAPTYQQPSFLSTKELIPKRIHRHATHLDLRSLAAKSQEEALAVLRCTSRVRARRLPMEIVDAEYQWDRNKLTFYFLSEQRIDFRELVRELFRIYKTRIWMCAVERRIGGLVNVQGMTRVAPEDAPAAPAAPMAPAF